MIVLDCDQNSETWINGRAGIPTASCYHKIVTSTGERSKQRQGYMYQLAGERITGRPHKGFHGPAMDRGHEMEEKSRQLYEIQNHVTVQQVGLCYQDELKLYGASPDGLVGEDGGFETKDAAPHIQAERLHKGWTGMEHHRQVMGCTLVCNREWWDLVSYCQGMRPVTIRFERDEAFLTILKRELLMFCSDLEEMVKKIRGEEYVTVVEPEALPEKTYPVFEEIEKLRIEDAELMSHLEEKYGKPTSGRQAAIITREFNKQKG